MTTNTIFQSKYEDIFSLWLDIQVIKINTMYKYRYVCNYDR